MGYTTEFTGRFTLDRALQDEHYQYLLAFSKSRHMKRDGAKTAHLPDPLREAAQLPLGREAEFYVGGHTLERQSRSEDVVDRNNPPESQPSLWCHWCPSEDRKGIEWNGAEKFYAYEDWLEYLRSKFLTPWGYKLSGSVGWLGEDLEDSGVLSIVEGLIAVDTLDLHSEEPDVISIRGLMLALYEPDNFPLDVRIKAAKEIITPLTRPNPRPWLYLPVMAILWDTVLIHEEVVAKQAIASLLKLARQGLLFPLYITKAIGNHAPDAANQELAELQALLLVGHTGN